MLPNNESPVKEMKVYHKAKEHLISEIPKNSQIPHHLAISSTTQTLCDHFHVTCNNLHITCNNLHITHFTDVLCIRIFLSSSSQTQFILNGLSRALVLLKKIAINFVSQ